MIYHVVITQFSKMLLNMSAFLDKGAQHAATKKCEVEVLLRAHLAPDQFNLTKQVQVACDTAKLAAARLAGKEAPSHPDTEKTLPELKTRIESVLGYLATFTEKDFAGAEARRITTPRWEGKSLSGAEYAIQHAMPNFYFHLTTAYDILRHNGVDVGKKDFLGALPYQK
jgi:uncharacterized protein